MYFIVAKHVDSSGMTTPFHKGKNEATRLLQHLMFGWYANSRNGRCEWLA